MCVGETGAPSLTPLSQWSVCRLILSETDRYGYTDKKRIVLSLAEKGDFRQTEGRRNTTLISQRNWPFNEVD